VSSVNLLLKMGVFMIYRCCNGFGLGLLGARRMNHMLILLRRLAAANQTVAAADSTG
jgi:hypothetical protein